MLALQSYYELKLVIIFYVLNNLPHSDMKLSVVMNITNIFIAHSALNTQDGWKSETKYGDSLPHSEVCWLSKGKILSRFIACIDEIQVFLTEMGETYLTLNDETWQIQLWLLTHITDNFNSFSLHLQGNYIILGIYKECKFSCRELTLYEDTAALKFRYSLRGTTSACNSKKLIQDLGMDFWTIFGPKIHA